MHLVFYDGECGLCDRAVQFVLKADKEKKFLFAPLQGTTAEELLADLPPKMKQADSLILIENYKEPTQQLHILGKGALRICWLLGGAWRLFGWLSYLPPILYDWGYRLVAQNRHRLFPQTECVIPDPAQKDRFLP